MFFLVSPWTLPGAEVIRPVDSVQFFVRPDVVSEFLFSVEDERPVPFCLRNEAGNLLEKGESVFRDGKHVVSLAVPRGFAEIEFPESVQDVNGLPMRFGIVALPVVAPEDRDPFFCIDGALSWLVEEDARREDYVNIAAQVGISTIRERLSWTAINREENKFDWEGDRRYDKLRRAVKDAGIELLEVFHDAPDWTGHVGKFPEDLLKTVDAWEKIAEHWEPTWAGLEIWNEPDIFFSGNMPADQYVPLVRGLTFRLKKSGVQVPLIGGSLAHFNPTWLDTARFGGLFSCIDGFSFHTYSRAPSVQHLFNDISRESQNGRPDLTLWLTECGRPWKRGPERPPRDWDIESACDIVMKGVEAKASVVDRYFPFVFPYYDENGNNFGMMDKNGSPLRSMGAYVQMIRMLSGCEFIDADVPWTFKHVEGPNLVLARVFEKRKKTESDPFQQKQGNVKYADRDMILVLYTGDTTKPTTIRPDVDDGKPKAVFLHAESLTGETVPIEKDGTITIRDGLVYVRVQSIELHKQGGFSGASTTMPGNARYWKADGVRRFGMESRVSVSPIAVLYRFDPETVEPNVYGYYMKQDASKPIPLKLRVCNFDDVPHELSFRPSASTGKPVLAEGETKNLAVPARGFAEQTILVDLSDEFAREPKAEIRFRYHQKGEGLKSGNPDVVSCPVQLIFFGEPTWEKMLAANPDAIRLPIEDRSRWRTNIAGIGKMNMDEIPRIAFDGEPSKSEPETAWTFRAEFGDGDRWVYPVFTLPDDVDLTKHKGMILRARCSKGNTQPRLMVFENGRVGYMTTGSAFGASGDWRVVKISFESLEHCGATGADENGKLDLDRVRTFSIGANTQETEIQIDVSDCLLY